MKQKTLLVILACVLVAVSVACGSKDEPSSESQSAKLMEDSPEERDISVEKNVNIEALDVKKACELADSMNSGEWIDLDNMVAAGTISTETMELTIELLEGFAFGGKLSYILEGDEPYCTVGINKYSIEKTKALKLNDRTQDEVENISQLENLIYLDLSGDDISDLSFLSNLKSLKGLNITGINVTDLSPLANLTDLCYLELGSIAQITDITPIATIDNLRDLTIRNISSADLSPLADLTSLIALTIIDENVPGTGDFLIDNSSVFSSLSNLKLLSLPDKQIIDIEPLRNLTKLESLYLRNNQITNIEPLCNLTNLKILNLSCNQIADIGAVCNLTNLRSLDLEHNQIADVLPLTDMINLEELDLSGNLIVDVSSLANLVKLTNLNLSNNYELSSIVPLAGLTNLSHFDISMTSVNDITPIYNFINLTYLGAPLPPSVSDEEMDALSAAFNDNLTIMY